MPVNFEWDEKKAIVNIEKHGLSFDEASTVFADPLYVDLFDPDHSDEEQRYLNYRDVRGWAVGDSFLLGKRRCSSNYFRARADCGRKKSL